MRPLASLVLCLGFILPVQAGDLDEASLAKIPERMKRFVENQQISGAVTVVGTSKGIARIDALGKSDLAKDSAMEKDTLFRIASMTKPITALGIMLLVEEGKLKLDDPVEKHLT